MKRILASFTLINLPKGLEKILGEMKKQGKDAADKMAKSASILTEKFKDDQAKKILAAKESTKLQINNFQKALQETADKHKISMEDVRKRVTVEGLRLATALKAGFDAFLKSMKKD